MAATRILFVDDEADLRLTFPLIMKMHGFEVRTAGTVAEALAEITTHSFDVLISDLNIGEAGDGFTVVSAMRRTQPNCINFLLTGFPAFESALAGLRRHVDEYLLKPARSEQVVALIEKRLRDRCPHKPTALVRIPGMLRENLNEIRESALGMMKSHPELGSIQMSDEERVGHVPAFLHEIANQMESKAPDEPTRLALQLGREHGIKRLREGYEIWLLVAEMAILRQAVYDLVRQRLLLLDTSYLVTDLRGFNTGLELQLQEMVRAFWDETGRGNSRAGG